MFSTTVQDVFKIGLLLEYEGKQLFKKYKIPVVNSMLVTNEEEAKKASETLGLPVAVKAQVLSGRRGKRGLIKIAKTPEEVIEYSKQILSMESDGRPVTHLLIEEGADIEKEFFISMIFDPETYDQLVLFSTEGGVDIEELANERPEAIERITLPFNTEIYSFHFIDALKRRGLEGKVLTQTANIMATLAKMMYTEDLTLAEINPLVVTKSGEVIALDSKVGTDDDAIFRHPERKEYLSEKLRYTKEEKEAKEKGLAYVDLGGDIGMLSCGAGMGMATADLIEYFGGSPRNFLDVGGGASPEKVEEALRIMTSVPGLKSILINAFGGITRLDDVAKGIIEAKKKYNINIPIVIRFSGTNQEEGVRILKEHGLDAYLDMEPAIEKAVELAKKEEA